MKTKLSIDQQIEDLKSKGVKFEHYSEEEARKFLRYNNYYYKFKSYARNYDQYRQGPKKGKYVNLDFAYLVEISRYDMYLRRAIVTMCLDIEHHLKTRLIYDVTINPEENGYSIVNKYADGLKLNQFYSNDKGATGDLIRKIKDSKGESPIWQFVEILTFGEFIELYTLYYQTDGARRFKNYIDYLGSIKYLRNAAAHNTCLLNSVKKPYTRKISKTKKIMETLAASFKLSNAEKKKMENPLIHDFIILLYVYNDLLNTPKNRSLRESGMNMLEDILTKTFLRKKEWFSKNDALRENYLFVMKIFNHIKNKRNQNVGLKF